MIAWALDINMDTPCDKTTMDQTQLWSALAVQPPDKHTVWMEAQTKSIQMVFGPNMGHGH